MRRIALLFLSAILMALAGLAFGQAPPVKVEFTLDKKLAKVGSRISGKVRLSFQEGYHGYQNPPSKSYMIPVTVKGITKAAPFVKVLYPQGFDLKVGGEPDPVRVYGSQVDIPVVIQLPKKPGALTIKAEVGYQQCTMTNCFQPETVVVAAKLKVVKKLPAAKPSASVDGAPQPAGAPPGVPAEQSKAGGKTVSTTDIRGSDNGLAGLLKDTFKRQNYLLLFGLLLLVGLAINLTPCVYPLIPVTMSFFSNQTSRNRIARLGLGFMYATGIALTYGLVGGIAAGVGTFFGALFTQTWFMYALAGLMIALALSMFDVYEISLPQSMTRQLKGRSGPVGALAMGLLVGIATAPCAGPLIAAIFTEVAKVGSVPYGVSIFTIVGLGIGLPYVVLAAMSSGAKALPKAGAWMKVVKALLGIVVLAVGLGYLLQALPRVVGQQYGLAIWAGFYTLAAITLLLYSSGGASRATLLMSGGGALALGLLAGMTIQQLRGPAPKEIAWKPYTDAAFAAAAKSGKPIVIDATADWCVACKEMDEKVFKQPESIAATQDFIALRIDWSTNASTGEYRAATAKRFGITGLPQVMMFAPGGRQTAVFRSFSGPQEFVQGLKEASGK